jgi:hypothetical protein
MIAASGFAAALVCSSPGAQAAISIDGILDDWSDVPLAFEDAEGDDGPSGVDFGRLWVADDDRFLFLRLEVGPSLDLSESNNLRLYLDTDANADTGLPFSGIGAELVWRFGERTGRFYVGDDYVTIAHGDVRLRSGPTVTATEFEIAIGRDTLPDGVHPLFTGDEVRLIVRDVDGDYLPDQPGHVSYVLDDGAVDPPVPIPLEREQPDDARIMTMNVLSDGLWDPFKEQRFRRIFRAIEPDVFALQEIYSYTTISTRQLIEQWLPEHTWFATGNFDCKVVSRFPVIDSWAIDGNVAVLLDASDRLDGEILLINAHLPCCTNDEGRQYEIDHIMAFIRDAREPGGPLDLEPDTPIIITGDMNFVGFAQQLETALTGDIVNDGIFGGDFAPDWDGSALTSVVSRQTELRMGYTWRSDTSSFWPGHLDYIIHSDAVLELGRHFILYTPEMSPAQLDAYGLWSTDSTASDHLAFCADFRIPCVGDLNGSGGVDVGDLLVLLGTWGEDGAGDLDGDGTIGVGDLLMLLGAWSSC